MLGTIAVVEDTKALARKIDINNPTEEFHFLHQHADDIRSGTFMGEFMDFHGVNLHRGESGSILKENN